MQCSVLTLASSLGAQTTAVTLPELMVNSPRVANQSPAAMFAMPVSALRYEPRVDVQARNLTEAILWHGGEAEKARDAFAALAREDRDALLRFLESL